MLFVNLPVTDLDASIAFFTALGFEFNPQFTDENATCMVINELACVMLLRRDFFETFHQRGTAEPGAPMEVITTITTESREEVNELCHRAFAAGGSRASDATDQGFMYGWSFADPDGHIWEVLWMDQTCPPA